MSEEQLTAEERAKAFIEEYGELVKKHQIDFGTFPSFIPDGQGGFKVVVNTQPIDIKDQPKKSPFVAEEK